ncbi:hypothetical protein [Candidatus Amarobacter glycogenicus]
MIIIVQGLAMQLRNRRVGGVHLDAHGVLIRRLDAGDALEKK